MRFRHFGLCGATVASLIAVASESQSQDTSAKTAAAVAAADAALDFGVSLGKILWITVNPEFRPVNDPNTEPYRRLALKVKQQIEMGRASSALLKANFDVIGTALAYTAVTDPEPMTKTAAAVAAWAAKKTGDGLAQKVLDQSLEQARGILSEAIKQTSMTDQDIDSLSPEQFRARVKDLRYGNATVGEILKDDPKSLQMLEAQAQDIASTVGLRTLSVSEGTAKTAAEIRMDLQDMRSQLEDFQQEVASHFQAVEKSLKDLKSGVDVANQKLTQLSTAVAGNTKAIKTLAEISFGGWSTSQKLQALQSGMFPDLPTAQRDAIVDSLQADLRREKLVGNLQAAAQDFGSLATIAANLGLPRDLVTGLQGAQLVATGFAQFAMGNYLGGVASVTSLMGLGAPDAGAVRHAQMMKFLQQEFAQVNAKLDHIIKLQVQTMQAIEALATSQQKFRAEVLSQLDRIEAEVLSNSQILQALMLQNWKECHAIINGPLLNGQFEILDRVALLRIVKDADAEGFVGNCYATMVTFLDAWVRTGDWSGQSIAAGNFPKEVIEPDPKMLLVWQAYAKQRLEEYRTARDFIVRATTLESEPALLLARLAQPVVSSKYEGELSTALSDGETHGRLSSFDCSDREALSEALRSLLCFGLAIEEGKPLPGRLMKLLDAALIGPHSFRIIDTGITLSSLVDVGTRRSGEAFRFVNPDDIEHFTEPGKAEPLKQALAQGKGRALLKRLQWLSEIMVVQQSVAYGDLTAALVERVLYDPKSRALMTKPSTGPNAGLEAMALKAIRANPLLARNVVTLAMRHAIADAAGGVEPAKRIRFNETYYTLGKADIQGDPGCGNPLFGDYRAFQKLKDMFPNWQFEIRLTANDRSGRPWCMAEIENDFSKPDSLPSLGSGLAVNMGDFYVIAPSPIALSEGYMEQPESLRVVLKYRDKLAHKLIDREFGTTVRVLFGARRGADVLTFQLVNEGLFWRRTPP